MSALSRGPLRVAPAREFLLAGVLLAVILLGFVGWEAIVYGAISIVRREGTVTYGFSPWLKVASLAAGAGLLTLAVLLPLLGRSWKVAFVPAFLGIVAAAVGTSTAAERVTIDRSSFTVRSGSIFGAETRTVRFADVANIVVKTETVRGPKDRRSENFLVCTFRNGAQEQFEVTELMEAGAEAKILQLARAAKIPVEDRTSRW